MKKEARIIRSIDSITPEEINLFIRVINTVWNAIAPDITDLEEMDNESAIESCLDANHPSIFAGEDGRKVDSLSIAFEYGDINKFFAKRMSLV